MGSGGGGGSPTSTTTTRPQLNLTARISRPSLTPLDFDASTCALPSSFPPFLFLQYPWRSHWEQSHQVRRPSSPNGAQEFRRVKNRLASPRAWENRTFLVGGNWISSCRRSRLPFGRRASPAFPSSSAKRYRVIRVRGAKVYDTIRPCRDRCQVTCHLSPIYSGGFGIDHCSYQRRNQITSANVQRWQNCCGKTK